MNSFFLSLLNNLVAAVIFAAVIYFLQRFRYWRALYRKFNKRTFDVYYQRDSELAVREVHTRVRRNIIYYDGIQLVEGKNTIQGPFRGEFIMNEFTLSDGQGIHYHLNWDGFNFPKIMIRKDKFYVQTDYVDRDYILRHQAFVWKLRERKIAVGHADL